jgi:hypothetical protein
MRCAASSPRRLEAETQLRPQVVAEPVPEGGRDARFASRAAGFDHRAADGELVLQAQDDQVPAGTRQAGEFCQYRPEAGQVDQSGPAGDDARRMIGQQQLVQPSEAGLAIGDTPPRRRACPVTCRRG